MSPLCNKGSKCTIGVVFFVHLSVVQNVKGKHSQADVGMSENVQNFKFS